MFSWLQELFSQLSYNVGLHNPIVLALLFFMGVFTDIGVPLLLTLEIFVLFASFYFGPLSIQVLLIVLMLLLGRECGAAIFYWVSRIVGTPFLHWLGRHFPWFLRGVTRIKSRLINRTTLAVVVVRLTPGFLQIPSLIAGSLHLRFLSFALGVAISSLIYDFGLVLFGFIARETLRNASENLRDYFLIGVITLVIIMWIFLFFRFRHIFDEK